MPNKVLITHREELAAVKLQDMGKTSWIGVIVGGHSLAHPISCSAGLIDFFFCSGHNYTLSRSEISNCMSVCVCVCVFTVDPQFYVTVTISSLLILTAVVITAKLW